jgi:hypothetical protein
MTAIDKNIGDFFPQALLYGRLDFSGRFGRESLEYDARVAKLVDAADSKSAAFIGVPVRVRPRALRLFFDLPILTLPKVEPEIFSQGLAFGGGMYYICSAPEPIAWTQTVLISSLAC